MSNISLQPALPGASRAGISQVEFGIHFVEFKSESVHAAVLSPFPDKFPVLVYLLDPMHGHAMGNAVFIKYME